MYAASPAGFPKDVKLVKRGSWAYYWALATARFWVDNQGFPHDLRKRPGTTYIQTWHGSAFKRMGFDEAAVKQATRGEQQRLQRAVDRFDVFLVRSEHDVRTLARRFGSALSCFGSATPATTPSSAAETPPSSPGCGGSSASPTAGGCSSTRRPSVLKRTGVVPSRSSCRSISIGW